MAGFQIDDVRESFQADVGGFLDTAEDASLLLSDAAPPPLLGLVDQGGRPLLLAVSEAGHSVAGTAGLVGAASLANSGRLLETLAEAGLAELRRAEAAMLNARRTVELGLEGIRAMREMVGLELDHRSAEANAIALAWSDRVQQSATAEALTLGPGAIGNADGVETARPPSAEWADPNPVSSRFTFTPSAEKPDAGLEGELREIFDAEVREAVASIEKNLGTLTTSPGDLATVGVVSRILHQIKGAAITVGLARAAEVANRLHDRTEEISLGQQPTSPTLAAEITAEVNAMLAETGLDLRLSTGTPAPDSLPAVPRPVSTRDEPLRAAYVAEATLALREAEALADAISKGDRGARQQLRALFHRLEGTALINGDSLLAQVAHDGRSLADSSLADPDVVSQVRASLGGAKSRGPASAPASFVREALGEVASGELWDAFREESRELLEALERTCLALEQSATPRTELQELMRQVHTLKGAMNTVGLSPSGRVLHFAEDFVEELIAATSLPPAGAIASFVLAIAREARDHIAAAGSGALDASSPDRLARLADDVRRAGAPSTGPSRDEPVVRPPSSGRAMQVPSSANLAVRRTTDVGIEERTLRIAAERLDALMNLAGELVVGRTRLSTQVASVRRLQREAAARRVRLRGVVEGFREHHEFSRARKSADRARPQAPVTEVTSRQTAGFGDLELDRYDDVNILARSLADLAARFEDVESRVDQQLVSLAEGSEELGRLVTGIQSEVTRARMVPVSSLFTRLQLPVRDAAQRERKSVRTVLRGESVNVDKTIIDELYFPLLHLVRNSVVHGIEDSATRASRQKPPTGSVFLSARQEAGQIVVEVTDDGGGLDLAALKARGVKLGLVDASVDADSDSVRELVFASGLSTRETAGDVAGRGMGGDVVKRTIERLNGSVRVETEAGRRTTFVLTLPLTLAITRAVVVRRGTREYAIPLYFSERLVRAEDAKIVDVAGHRQLRVGDEYVPVRDLQAILGEEEPAAPRPLVVLRLGAGRLALEVDRILGQQEIVVKSLGDVLSGHPVFAGATVDPAGGLLLILDVPGLFEVTFGTRGAISIGADSTAASSALDLPAAAPEAPEPEPSAPQLPPGALGGRPRLLVVDDSLSVRKVAEKFLGELGCDVVLAVDGLDALEKIHAQRFDLVFTDLEMPRMHGYELIRELRRIPVSRGLPVYVVTSRTGKRHRDEATEVGATGYLTKPFSRESFAEVLKTLGTGRDRP